jgi:integrase
MNRQEMIQELMDCEKGRNIDWNPEINYTDDSGTDQPRDYLTKAERKKIRETVLDYGSIPHYNSLSPEERNEWKSYLAQRFGKPKSEVGKSDWTRANSFKIPSLVYVSLDAGLRPVEVERSNLDWLDLENGVLRIPKSESSKNRDNWSVPLMEKTVTFLENWLEERNRIDKYDGRNEIWLTREGNPYDCYSLRHVMSNVCDLAGIDDGSRDVSWYSIRHSTATYMVNEESLGAAQQQLRHKSERTTMKYDQAPVEERRDALDRMG